jgi:hypothetical protein
MKEIFSTNVFFLGSLNTSKMSIKYKTGWFCWKHKIEQLMAFAN